MNLLTGWLTALSLRRTAPPPDTDFADMGTAFGLDASMGPGGDYPPQFPNGPTEQD